MSATITDSVKICEGVVWESIQSSRAQSYFPESALQRLDESGLDHAILTANPNLLLSQLGEKISTEGDEATEVRTVKGDSELVVKLAHGYFSYLAANVALEAGFVNGSRYATPNYLGALTLGNDRVATVMTRVQGKPLKDLECQQPEANLLLEAEVMNAGKLALQRVGLRPGAVYWDLNSHNIFVPPHTTSQQLGHSRLTILDQMSPRRATAQEWHEYARSKDYEGDPRDRAAEQAAEAAWGRYGPLTAA